MRIIQYLKQKSKQEYKWDELLHAVTIKAVLVKPHR